jgi:HD superfamily phosphohydrolase
MSAMDFSKNFVSTEMRDVIHGSIDLYPWELAVIDSQFFQRLRNIKQLGFAEYAYPSATHNRYTHSVGAAHLAGLAFQEIFKKHFFSSKEVFYRYFFLSRLCGLLHDIGHGPFSHAIEFAMPLVDKMGLPKEIVGKDTKRQASHEDYTLKIILDSSLTPILQKQYSQFGIKPQHIAAVMNLSLTTGDDFFDDSGVNFRKILHQVISSEMDADRMDYLQRDSYFTGVSYGKFDQNWLLSNLNCHFTKKTAHLAIKDRAIYAFEDFLLSRYHMFLMVYLHHKSVVCEEMLKKYLAEAPDALTIPADVEKYAEYDDATVMTLLKKNRKNDWARRLVERKTFKVALELHAGLNSKKDVENDSRVKELEAKLKSKKIPMIKTSSGKALSSYTRPNLGAEDEVNDSTIFVEFSDRLNPSTFVPVEKFTDLFKRYAETKNIVRIFVPEDTKIN